MRAQAQQRERELRQELEAKQYEANARVSELEREANERKKRYFAMQSEGAANDSELCGASAQPHARRERLYVSPQWVRGAAAHMKHYFLTQVSWERAVCISTML